MTMRTGATIVVATIGLGVMSGCSLDGRARETDRMVDTLALAVSYPPQASIDGYHRAILDTRIARQAPDPETNGQANDDPTTYLIVLDTETHERPDDVSDRAGRIRVLVHLPGSQAGFVRSEPYDACYDLVVSTTGGAVDRERIDCPSDPVPAGPPPPPPPVAVVPPGAAQDLDRVLRRLPRSPTASTVVRAVEHGLASPGRDPDGRPFLAPAIDASVEGADIAVTLWAPESRSCLIGVRIAGDTQTGFLGRTAVAAGELTCDADTALAIGRGQIKPAG